MNTLIADQLGIIQAEHLERGGMARPKRPERARVVDLLKLAPEGCAEVKGVGEFCSEARVLNPGWHGWPRGAASWP